MEAMRSGYRRNIINWKLTLHLKTLEEKVSFRGCNYLRHRSWTTTRHAWSAGGSPRTCLLHFLRSPMNPPDFSMVILLFPHFQYQPPPAQSRVQGKNGSERAPTFWCSWMDRKLGDFMWWPQQPSQSSFPTEGTSGSQSCWQLSPWDRQRLRGPRNTTGPGHSSQPRFSKSCHGAVLHEALGSGLEQWASVLQFWGTDSSPEGFQTYVLLWSWKLQDRVPT